MHGHILGIGGDALTLRVENGDKLFWKEKFHAADKTVLGGGEFFFFFFFFGWNW